ncbi:hypothetical protein [Methanobrevibacter smithii]|uniref:hypothetical protein n=1 Tax=Methanobrevibacter smithii TaxID=2173 RepID=UPI0037DCA77C
MSNAVKKVLLSLLFIVPVVLTVIGKSVDVVELPKYKIPFLSTVNNPFVFSEPFPPK